jgi:hypothetical protein
MLDGSAKYDRGRIPCHRMAEHKHATYFAIHREMDREQTKKKREERVRKCEKTRRTKEAFARGSEQVLIKDKWTHLTQN